MKSDLKVEKKLKNEETLAKRGKSKKKKKNQKNQAVISDDLNHVISHGQPHSFSECKRFTV